MKALGSLLICFFILALPCQGLDENANGMSDVFEKLYGVSDPNADPDGDGANNLLESIAGTNPNLAAESEDAKFQAFIEPAADGVTIKWWGVQGKRYEIQSTNDLLQSWGFFAGPFTGANGWISVNDMFPPQPISLTTESPSEYFPFTHPVGRGQYDGVDPANPFLGSLANNLGLWWSILYDCYGYSLGQDGPWDDPDGDGQPNVVESRAYTNPWSATSRIQATLSNSGENLVIEWFGPTGLKYRLETPVTFTLQSSENFVANELATPADGAGLPAQVYAARIARERPLRLTCFSEMDSWKQTSVDFTSVKREGVNMQFATAQIRAATDTSLHFVWNGDNGMTYIVDASASLSDWRRYDIPQTALDGTQPGLNPQYLEQTILLTEGADSSGSHPKKFYRIQTLAPSNADGDDFDEWEEYVIGTDSTVANGKPPWWDDFNPYGPWESENEGAPPIPVPPLDGNPNGNVVAQAYSATEPEDIQTAPQMVPYLLVETVRFYWEKWGILEYRNDSLPVKRFYKRRVITSSLQGGCPESPVGGTVTTTYSDIGGFETTTLGVHLWPPGASWSILGPTSRTASGVLGEYDDLPDLEPDCPGNATVTETLSEEYTTSELQQKVRANIPAFTGHYEFSFHEHAGKDLAVTEESFYISKLNYKFQFSGFNTENLPQTVNWLIKFTPENSSSAIYKAYTWRGTANETPVYSVDPDVENGGMDGEYEVYVLPTYFRVNGESPTPFGKVITKGSTYTFSADFHGYPELDVPVKWYQRQFLADGSWTQWAQFGTGLAYTHTTTTGGIYQVKGVIEVGETALEMHYIRPESESLGFGKAGQIDMLGVVDNLVQITVRDAAKMNIGSTNYADVTSYLPAYAPGSSKCNLFVAHKCTDAGAFVPWFNYSTRRRCDYPPSANQWAGKQSTKSGRFSTFIEGWDLQGSTPPQPGWVVAHAAASGSGHVGVTDYDGRGIAAGTSGTVNKLYREFVSGASEYRRYNAAP